jgi:hypothetical protein
MMAASKLWPVNHNSESGRAAGGRPSLSRLRGGRREMVGGSAAEALLAGVRWR